MLNPRDIIRRLMEAAGVSTQADLARSLDIAPQRINEAITRRQIPDVWLYKVAYATGRRVEWLRTGQGAECLSEVVAEQERRYGLEEEAVRLFLTRRLALDDDQRPIIDRLMDLLLRADDETRAALLALLNKSRDSSR